MHWRLQVLLLLACALAARSCDPAAPAATCGYGGLCSAQGVCACRHEWTGENCTQLALAPAANALAFSSPGGSWSSWGGSALRWGSRYIMVLARMAGHCGLGAWEANSEIALASSPSPDGPYAFAATILPHFAHNPTLHATPNGSLVVAHIGSGVPYHAYNGNCTQGFTPPLAAAAAAAAAAPQLALGVPGTPLPPPNFLYLAPGLAPEDVSAWRVLNSSGGAWAANNPALLLEANGSALLVYKVGCACPPPCVFCRQFGVATAPGWEGPYTDMGLIPVWGEDAYVWRDPPGTPGGGYHMLSQGGSYAPQYPTYTGHWHAAFSPDGLAWVVEVGSEAFNASIALQAGGALELQRRERHQVMFDATGAPSFLFNGATAAGCTTDHSFTVVQPIG